MQGFGVFLEAIPETLVGKVDKGDHSFLCKQLCNLFPLGEGWIDSGRVVAASVEADQVAAAAVGLQVLNHRREVERCLVGRQIRINVRFEASGLEDRSMVRPSRVAQPNSGAGKMFCDRVRSDAEGTGSSWSLSGSHSSVFQFGAKNKVHHPPQVFLVSFDGHVAFGVFGVQKLHFRLFNGRQNRGGAVLRF